MCSLAFHSSQFFLAHTSNLHIMFASFSTDLINWRTVSYAYSTLTNSDAMNLNNGQSAYGKGSWASSLRYKDGTFYVLVPSYTTFKTHLYSTTDATKTPWKELAQLPFYHDPSLFFDDNGRVFVVYGASNINIVELNSAMTAPKTGGLAKTLIPNAQSITGDYILNAEGSHLEKVNGYYYVFNIDWPKSGYDGRTELVYRSKTLDGTYEGKVAISSKGVAQGSIVVDSHGKWWGYLFKDSGAVGRCPWLMPVSWQNNWPVFNGGTSPTAISMPSYLTRSTQKMGVVSSDDFSSTSVKLEWQWNHNPDNTHWSLSARPGFYRITTSRVDSGLTTAKNSLTQRSFGPTCSGRIALDASGLKDGDVAGLAALQDTMGFVAVKNDGGALSVVYYEGTKQVRELAQYWLC